MLISDPFYLFTGDLGEITAHELCNQGKIKQLYYSSSNLHLSSVFERFTAIRNEIFGSHVISALKRDYESEWKNLIFEMDLFYLKQQNYAQKIF
jgi:hypothetical protein